MSGSLGKSQHFVMLEGVARATSQPHLARTPDAPRYVKMALLEPHIATTRLRHTTNAIHT
jgi:hypothetical protein